MLFQSKVLLALQRRFFGIFSRNEETFRGAHIRSKVNNCRRVKLQLIHHFASSWCNPIHLLRVCRKRRFFCRVEETTQWKFQRFIDSRLFGHFSSRMIEIFHYAKKFLHESRSYSMYDYVQSIGPLIIMPSI